MPHMSHVMCSRIPNRDIHELMRADAHDIVVLSPIGETSVDQVERSVTISK